MLHFNQFELRARQVHAGGQQVEVGKFVWMRASCAGVSPINTSYMVCLTLRRSTPTPLEEFPCGSTSTRRVFFPFAPSAAERLTAVVVLPTPPFWFATAMIFPIVRPRFQRKPVPFFHKGSLYNARRCNQWFYYSTEGREGKVFLLEICNVSRETKNPAADRFRRQGSRLQDFLFHCEDLIVINETPTTGTYLLAAFRMKQSHYSHRVTIGTTRLFIIYKYRS